MEGNVEQELKRAWLLERRKGLGGTDAAAVLGLSPFASAHDVFMDKTDATVEPVVDDGNEPMLWGSLLEPVVLAEYARRTGLYGSQSPTLVPNPFRRIHRHRDFPHLIATPDALVCYQPDSPRWAFGVDAKTTSAWNARDWGEPGTDQVPVAYLAQAAHYMAVLDLPRWDIAVLIGGQDFRTYTVMRDLKLEAHMVATLNGWWQRHVVGDTPPPMDGSAGATRYLERRFPRDTTPPTKATPAIDVVADALKILRDKLATLGNRHDALVNVMREYIGDHEAVEGDTWSATWRKSRDTQVVNWEAVAVQTAAAFDAEVSGAGAFVLAEARAANTKTREGSRRFTFTVKS